MRLFARVMRCSIAALADQEGARDLRDRQAGHDAQRQRDLLGRGQIGMAADEQEAQDVVAVVRAVEPLGERGFGIVQVGDGLFGGQRFLLAAGAARCVERDVAADQDEPGGGIARRTVLRPVLQRPQAGLLERLLGRYRGRGNSAAARRAPGDAPRSARLDPGEVGHVLTLPGRNTLSGRISNAPAELLARARSRAVSSASSSVEQSTT